MNPDDLIFVGKSNEWLTYTDYEFISEDDCTLVTISYDSDSDTWFGTIRVSESADGDFGDDYNLTQDTVDTLVKRIC